MKRVLIFSTAYFPFIGGAEVAVKEITDRIFDTEFVMITARLDAKLPTQEKIGNIVVHRIGQGNKWDKFRLIWEGHKKAKTLGRFDTVWSIMASYAGFAALRFKKRNKDVPFVLTLQEGDSKWDIYKHVWWCWCYFKQIFKRANKIQAISNYLAKWAESMGAKCPITVAPNGVDVEKFKSMSAGSKEFRIRMRQRLQEKFSIPANAPLVITVSRLVSKNGVENLVSAMQKISPQAHLFVVGDGKLKNYLTRVAQKLNLSNRVHFAGTISQDTIPKLLWASDVFCRPSLSEGLGNAFLEAMCAGLPVVGTSVGGIPDFLKDGETGLFCKVNNPVDIAEKINKILADKNLAERLRNNGRKLVMEKYSWNPIAQKMKNIL